MQVTCRVARMLTEVAMFRFTESDQSAVTALVVVLLLGTICGGLYETRGCRRSVPLSGESLPYIPAAPKSRHLEFCEAAKDARATGEPAFMIMVELNTAPIQELRLLPGIGDVLGNAIIDRREKQGPFTSREQLLEIRGIGPKKYAAVKAYVYAAPVDASTVQTAARWYRDHTTPPPHDATLPTAALDVK